MSSSSSSSITATKSTLKSSSERAKQAWDKLEGKTYAMWDDFCDNLEDDDSPEWLQWISLNILRRLSVEAPVVVAFVFACTFMHFVVSPFLPHGSIFLGVDDFFAPMNPMHYVRQISHIFMHEDHDGWKSQHLRNNMTHMLLVGPSSEAVFGSVNLIYILIIVAIRYVLSCQ
jgi:membrane associated rhomboid family serine protease